MGPLERLEKIPVVKRICRRRCELRTVRAEKFNKEIDVVSCCLNVVYNMPSKEEIMRQGQRVGISNVKLYWRWRRSASSPEREGKCKNIKIQGTWKD